MIWYGFGDGGRAVLFSFELLGALWEPSGMAALAASKVNIQKTFACCKSARLPGRLVDVEARRQEAQSDWTACSHARNASAPVPHPGVCC